MALLLAHLSTECSVSYCDHSLSVGVHLSNVCPSVHNFLVYTLASTNINQSAPNLVKMYMTIRSGMSSIMEQIGPELYVLKRSQKSLIMDQIGPELSKLSTLESENLPYLTFFTL